MRFLASSTMLRKRGDADVPCGLRSQIQTFLSEYGHEWRGSRKDYPKRKRSPELNRRRTTSFRSTAETAAAGEPFSSLSKLLPAIRPLRLAEFVELEGLKIPLCSPHRKQHLGFAADGGVADVEDHFHFDAFVQRLLQLKRPPLVES